MRFQSSFPGTGGFLVPQKIINELKIVKKGMHIADFGSGAGYFTVPLAKKVGDSGKVFAIDILPEALEVVNSKIKIEGINNVMMIRCNLEKEGSCGLDDESCDIIWIVNLLFQTDDDKSVIQEAKRVLKKEGKLVLIEWRPEISFGPPSKKIKKENLMSLLKKQGLSLEKEFPTDDYHYGLIFKK